VEDVRRSSFVCLALMCLRGYSYRSLKRLSDLALLRQWELRSERHRSYDEIESSLRKLVVPYDESTMTMRE
jgi:hypothetical protein